MAWLPDGLNWEYARRMKRTIFALILSLIVSLPALAQTPAPTPRAKTIVDLVRDEIAKGDFREAEHLARAMKQRILPTTRL